MRPFLHILVTALVFLATLGSRTQAADFDLTPFADTTAPLANPHKGWYHHFPDNHLTRRYPIQRDEDLLGIPGMDHLYMRLAWAYLEPKEGQFDWDVIDKTIEKWTGKGLGIAFRISCRETGTDRIEQQFATPRWVIEAGAKGGFYLKGQQTDANGPWEPDFADPIFLEKLEQFLKAFAARYDGKPWLRYVDIGSIGDWGEGHTHSGSRKAYGLEVRKRHIDLHLKYFAESPLAITDDFIYAVEDMDDRLRLHRYVIEHGITYRDDSILVNGYIRGYTKTWTVRSPEFFADAYLKTPIVLELEHYSSVKGLGNWTAEPNSSVSRFGNGNKGPDYFLGALNLLRATYIGYHGYADQWWADNSELSNKLLNRCGYWYFLHGVTAPESWKPGSTISVTARWSNRGVAPAFHKYRLCLRLVGARQFDEQMESGNLNWLPSDSKSYKRVYQIRIPDDLRPGNYELRLKLIAPTTNRDVLLALKPELRDDEGYYLIGKVQVAR